MMTWDRCQQCPVPLAIRCRGLDVRRFCELLDPCCPQHDAGYGRVVLDLSMNAVAEPPRLAVAESIRLSHLMKACEFRSTGGAGCGCGRCGLRAGATVSHMECFACIRQYGSSP
jgi:hypothetical protein